MCFILRKKYDVRTACETDNARKESSRQRRIYHTYKGGAIFSLFFLQRRCVRALSEHIYPKRIWFVFPQQREETLACIEERSLASLRGILDNTRAK